MAAVGHTLTTVLELRDRPHELSFPSAVDTQFTLLTHTREIKPSALGGVVSVYGISQLSKRSLWASRGVASPLLREHEAVSFSG